MKARIKETGEIAEFSTGKNLQGETILLKVGTASIFSLNEVEPIHDIDCKQVQTQAKQWYAISFNNREEMCKFLNKYNFHANDFKFSDSGIGTPYTILYLSEKRLY